MRTISVLLLALLVSFSNNSTARELVVLDFIGYGWETEGFPPSEAGDILSIPLIVDDLSAAFGVDLGEEEVTGYMSGLVSEGAEEILTGLWRIRYTQGALSFYSDAAPDHEFGTFPPNATAPATFTNGELCLQGDLVDFTFYYHEPTGAGSMEANVTFVGGDCLDAIAGLDPTAFTFGGFLTRQSSGSVVEGYDLQLDGFLEARTTDSETCEFDCFALSYAIFELEDDKDRDKDDDDRDDDKDKDDDDDDDDDDDKDKDKDGNKGSRGDDDDRKKRDKKKRDRKDRDRHCDRHGKCLNSEFELSGGFATCGPFTDFDPETVEITLRLGDYLETLPAGSLEYIGNDTWEYAPKRACGELESFVLEHEGDNTWEFEAEAPGIATALLLPDGKELHLSLTVGGMTGSQTVELEDDDDECYYESDHEFPCSEDDLRDLAWGSQTLLPRDTGLAAHPNPFRQGTTLFLNAARASQALVEVYDLRGRIVRVLHSGRVRAGEQQWQWDGSDDNGVPVASGIYFYRVRTGDTSTVHKIIRMK